MIKISNDDNIVRYCKPLTLDSYGNPTGKSFESRPGEEYISVDWLEFFRESSTKLKLKKLLITYNRRNLTPKKSGKLAILNVGEVLNALLEDTSFISKSIQILQEQANDSHAGIYGCNQLVLQEIISENFKHLYQVSEIN